MNCSRFVSAFGSSPLARGLRREVLVLRPRTRIIPARAGFTQNCGRPGRASRDHPRSRGVYSSAAGRVLMRFGSSPLARGLHIVRVRPHGYARIIPARAGFTDIPAIGATVLSGSSPLARGLLGTVLAVQPLTGIIPARAGFTSRWTRPDRSPWDHPRSRGVYACGSVRPPSAPGSSPLARGLLQGCTGCSVYTRDHPRSRGVYVSDGLTVCPDGGSSPLARGLRLWERQAAERTRIIPARAGFT